MAENYEEEPSRISETVEINGWFGKPTGDEPTAHAPKEQATAGSENDQEIDQLLDVLTGERSASENRPQTKGTKSSLPAAAAGALGMAALIAFGALIWIVATNRANADGGQTVAADVAEADAGAVTETSPAGPDLQREAEELDAAFGALGLSDVHAEAQGSTIHLSGSVDNDEDLQRALGAAAALGGDATIDSSGLTVSPSASPVAEETNSASATLDQELKRLLASTPIIYETGETNLTALQERILNRVADLLTSYQGVPVRIIGYTDDFGADVDNTRLSETRAEIVRQYLISQGVPAGGLTVVGAGEELASGVSDLSGLERRVEIEVAASQVPRADAALIRVGIVAPSARNDLAFTQSMVDAVNVIAAERGNVEVEIVDNTFVPDDVAVAMQDFASRDFELIIAHGSQFGPQVAEVAAQFPNSKFAWGTVGVEPSLPNIYSYHVAAEEGGYVLGALAMMLSSSKTVGVVGPIEVGDAQAYIDGFRAGAIAEDRSADVHVAYTGSFTDTALAREVADMHIDDGADVLTGTSQMVVGAIAASEENDAVWIGNQADQSSLAPEAVVASQVYHWEVILRPIIVDIDLGANDGRLLDANMTNGGVIIERNPDYQLPADADARIRELTAGIIAGTIRPPSGS